MREFFEKIRKLWPGGLAGKLIRFVVILVFCMGLAFLLMSRIQVAQLKKAVKSEEQKQSELIEGEFSESMQEVTRDTLLQLSIWAADKTDDEFWVLDHDLRVLGLQVEDVFRHPENYARIPVSRPEKENEGTFALQLLCGGDYEDIAPETMEMLERLANLEPMMKEIVRGNEGYTLDCYISTPDEVTLAMDDLSGGKFDETGKLKAYVPSTRPWYQGAVELGDMYISSAVHSFFYHFNEVVYGYPVYVDGELVAVLEASTRLGIIETKMAERNVGEEGFSVLISKGGQLVCSQREKGELMMREDLAEDIRGSVNPQLVQLIDQALAGGSGVTVVEVDGEQYLASYGPLRTVGWTQITFASVKEMAEPTNRLLKTMEESTDHVMQTLAKDFKLHSILLILGLLAFMQTAILMVSFLAKKRVKPIQQMTEAVEQFVDEDMAFEMKAVYRTGDEIEKLAVSFEFMSEKMKQYVAEIVENTAEKERIQAEMEAASQIQVKMLPVIQPDFYEQPGYELYAMMDTAKAVGGDLYDFYYLDDDRLVIMIGDVSGKGITAALFMALSKQMIKAQMLLHDGDLVAAMNEANKRLCEESADSMFVTVWIGILKLSTGELEFVNAGHPYAAVKRGDGEFVQEADQHSMLMGALKFAVYKRNVTTLQKGDVVYLYTDGVTEAHDKEEALFGDERFLSALNRDKNASPEDLDRTVRADIREFVEEAEQYDDITTVCFKYTGV